MNRYILNSQKEPIPEPDLIKWALWIENIENRRVAETELFNAQVSTVFLGLDHSWFDGAPLVFETMVFVKRGTELEDQLDNYQERFHTWDEAITGHHRIVDMVKAKIDSLSQI